VCVSSEVSNPLTVILTYYTVFVLQRKRQEGREATRRKPDGVLERVRQAGSHPAQVPGEGSHARRP